MSTKKISILALFLALAVIGASIKIPAFIGSIALDVFPALLAAVLLGRESGAIVAGFGHMISALIGGMPLGPIHFIIAVEMALIVWVFAIIYQTGKRKIAGLVFVIVNSLLAPFPMIFLFGIEFYMSVLLPLFIGACFNVVIAFVFIPRLEHIFKDRLAKVGSYE